MDLWQLKIITHPFKQICSVLETLLGNVNGRATVSLGNDSELKLCNEFYKMVNRKNIKFEKINTNICMILWIMVDRGKMAQSILDSSCTKRGLTP